MADTIQIRRGTTSAWNSANPVLALGEQGYDTTTRQTKVGDGTTAWTSLAYTLADGMIHRPSVTNTFAGGAGTTTNASGGCTGFGVGCLVAAATVNDSVGIGSYALQYMTGGVGNTAVGSYALQDVVSVGNNTAVGDSALRRCLTDGSTAVGYVCLENATTGLYNNGFGRGVLQDCVTGNRNCAFGNEVLASATGSDNGAFGHNALYNQVTGAGNVAVGSKAGLILEGGSNNTFIGFEAAGVVGQGNGVTNSITIGYRSITAFSNSIVIGNSSHTRSQIFGGFFSHGAGNIATSQIMGLGAGLSATAANTTAYGVSAAFSLTSGVDNVAVGWQAMYGTTTGLRNVVVGTSGLQSNVGGYGNTAIGYAAGLLTTSDINTYVGYNAGGRITSGTTNTFIGNEAGNNASQLATAVNSMALGNGAFTTASNQVVVGNSSVTETILRGTVKTDVVLHSRTAVVSPVAGGAQAFAIGSDGAVGVYWGSGAPSAGAGQGSIYIRTDGSSTTNRMYINTNGGTTWTAVTTQI